MVILANKLMESLSLTSLPISHIMNWKSLFFLSTIGWLSFFLLTRCEPGTVAVTGSTAWEHINCHPKDTSSECAKIKEQIAAYHETLATSIVPMLLDSTLGSPIGLKPPLNFEILVETSLLEGFQYHLGELEWIVSQARRFGRDSVYLMLAVNDDPTSIQHRVKMGSPIKLLDLYFQVKSNQTGELITYKTANGDLPQDAFADFPTPCPESCP